MRGSVGAGPSLRFRDKLRLRCPAGPVKRGGNVGIAMAEYFLVHDAAAFEGEVRPALAAAWRRRSFEPCRPLCARLAPAARSYAERYHTGPEEFVLEKVAGGLPFDRTIWRTVAG